MSINPIDDTESFYSLIAEKKYEIVIPMIQRDYAQGRIEEGEVRHEFLTELKNYIDSDRRGNNLDFVYGHVKRNELVVLDGQQRLTTLFLLHWYAAIIGGKKCYDLFKKWMYAEQHSSFSYHTRDSAKEFCNALVSFNREISENSFGLLVDKAIENIKHFEETDWNQIPEKEREEEKNKARVSSFIRNEKWFLAHWNEDPTILSMLNMLDAIEEFFPLSKYKDLYNKLIGLDGMGPAITFLYMDLDKYELTDTLYIKMNSRGRPLTRFENLKVKLLNLYEKQKRQKIAVKFDGNWTDIFWTEVVNKNKNTKKVFSTEPMDDMWLRFISVLCCNYYAVAHVESSKLDEVKSTIKEFTDSESEVKIEYSKILSVFRETNLKDDFEKILDYLIEKKAGEEIYSLKSNIKNSSYYVYYDFIDEFKTLISENKDYYNRLRFHAYYKYLLSYGLKNVDQWMRFICNVINNTTIDQPDEFAKALSTIEDICSCVKGDTVSYLTKTNDKDIPHTQLNSEQIEEEKIKIIASSSSIAWKEAIMRAEERLVYFSGKTALHYTGYLTFPLKYSDISLSNIEHDLSDENKFNNFNSIVELLIDLFPNKDGSNCETSLIRALLSTGDYWEKYKVDKEHESYSFLMNNHRDYSWKRYIASDEEGFFNSLVQKLLQNNEQIPIEDKLEKIYSSRKPTDDWRDILIENPRILNGYKDEEVFIANHRVIRFDSNKVYCFLNSKKGQYNHLHSELNSLCDYVNIKEDFINKNLDLEPYTNLLYNQIKDSSNEGFGFQLFTDLKEHKGWEYNNMNIFISCFFESSNTYTIVINNREKDNQVDINDKVFLKILNNLNYKKDSENNFVLQNVSRKDLKTKLKQICNEFKNL